MATFDDLIIGDFFVSLQDSKVYCKWTARWAVDNIANREVLLNNNPEVVKIPKPQIISSKILERWGPMLSNFDPQSEEFNNKLLLQGEPPGQGYCSVCGDQLIVGYIYQNHQNCLTQKTKGKYYGLY